MASEEIRLILQAQDQASKVFDDVSKKADGLFSQVAKGIGAGLGLGLFNPVAQGIGMAFSFATDTVIGFNASLEQSQKAWATMLGGAAEADAMLNMLKQFAASTPFEFPDVERGGKRLLAMGFNARQIIPLLTSVGDAAAALGVGRDGIDRITLALGQMNARTKVSADDMLQLTEVGIPAWQILAEATGKSIAQVQDAAAKGTISSQVFIDAFQKFSSAKWGGLMAEQAKTFSGAMSTIHDQIRIVGSDAFKPLFDDVSAAAQALANFLSSDDFVQWGNNVNYAIRFVQGLFDEIRQSPSVMEVLKAALIGVAGVLAVQLTTAALQASGAMLRLAATTILAAGPWVLLGAAIAAAALVVAANWDDVQNGIAEGITTMTDDLAQLVNWIQTTFVANSVTAWENFANTAAEAMDFVAKAWAQFWQSGIGTQLQSAGTALQAAAGAAFGAFGETIMNVIRSIASAWNQFVAMLGDAAGPLAAVLATINPPLAVLIGTLHAINVQTDGFTSDFKEMPAIVGQATSSVGRFTAFIGPAISKAVALVLSAATEAAGFVPALVDQLGGQTKAITDAFDKLGQQSGTAMGQGLNKIIKPLLEELANLIAQKAAEPQKNAVEDTQRAIDRAKLVLTVRGTTPEERQAARATIRDLTRNVLPNQQLAAFDSDSTVQITKRALDAANLNYQILQNVKEQADALAAGTDSTFSGLRPPGTATPPTTTAPTQTTTTVTPAPATQTQVNAAASAAADAAGQKIITAGGSLQDAAIAAARAFSTAMQAAPTAVAPNTAPATGAPTAVAPPSGAPTAVAPPPAPPPIQVHLILETQAGPNGDRTVIYDELLEANGQVKMPPVVQLSGVRR
jgi:tape measure domain-containing protein